MVKFTEHMLREGGFLEVEETINNMTSNIRKTKPHAPNNFGNEVKPMADTHLPGNTENLKSITLRVYYAIF